MSKHSRKISKKLSVNEQLILNPPESQQTSQKSEMNFSG